MADESKLQLEVLERKIAVARGELNKLRSDVKSVKKMFVQRFKEVEELVKKGITPLTLNQIAPSTGQIGQSCHMTTSRRFKPIFKLSTPKFGIVKHSFIHSGYFIVDYLPKTHLFPKCANALMYM